VAYKPIRSLSPGCLVASPIFVRAGLARAAGTVLGQLLWSRTARPRCRRKPWDCAAVLTRPDGDNTLVIVHIAPMAKSIRISMQSVLRLSNRPGADHAGWGRPQSLPCTKPCRRVRGRYSTAHLPGQVRELTSCRGSVLRASCLSMLIHLTGNPCDPPSYKCWRARRRGPVAGHLT